MLLLEMNDDDSTRIFKLFLIVCQHYSVATKFIKYLSTDWSLTIYYALLMLKLWKTSHYFNHTYFEFVPFKQDFNITYENIDCVIIIL